MIQKNLPQPEASEAGPNRRRWTPEKIGAIAGAFLGPIFTVVALILGAFGNDPRNLGDDLALIMGFALVGALIGGIAGKFISRFCKEKEKST